ncbi:hypothetical protein [Reichenbachiella sp.]|uniref:hypothetical protein n=1 Tax=Reichenbachiella sp. TaxID=2184521 RepID=UPI003BB20403
MKITIVEILTITLPAILGFLFSRLLDKVRSSSIQLQKRVSITTIAKSYKDDFWGDIQILHNNEAIDHLHMVTIELFNFSKKDVDDLTIQVAVGEQNKIVSSHAINTDTRVELTNSDAFNQLITQENWEFISSNREYQAKVLNRGTHLQFQLLIESTNEELNQNEIIIAIEKKGVKTISYKNISAELGGQWALVFGFLFTSLVALATYQFYPEEGIPILIVGIAGALNLLIGFVIYYSIIGWRHWNDEDGE